MNWFESWFDSDFYLTLYQHRDDEEAQATVQMIQAVADKWCRAWHSTNKSEKTVLDVACGSGRHAIAFAKQGFRVTANDLSKNLLSKAKQKAATEQVEQGIAFSNQDMRTMTFKQTFDVIIQLFTSFGYFENEQDDKRVLEKVYQHLNVGGVYVLDFFNDKKLVLPRHTTKTIGHVTVVEDVNLENEFVVKTIKVDQQHTFVEKVRKYSADELSNMIENAGFTIKQMIGDYSGQPFTTNSPRAIFFATKKHS